MALVKLLLWNTTRRGSLFKMKGLLSRVTPGFKMGFYRLPFNEVRGIPTTRGRKFDPYSNDEE